MDFTTQSSTLQTLLSLPNGITPIPKLPRHLVDNLFWAIKAYEKTVGRSCIRFTSGSNWTLSVSDHDRPSLDSFKPRKDWSPIKARIAGLEIGATLELDETYPIPAMRVICSNLNNAQKRYSLTTDNGICVIKCHSAQAKRNKYLQFADLADEAVKHQKPVKYDDFQCFRTSASTYRSQYNSIRDEFHRIKLVCPPDGLTAWIVPKTMSFVPPPSESFSII